MKIGHRTFLDPAQVKSSTGRNPNAWPLRLMPEKATRENVLGAAA
jgi:hypothetical protein